MRYLFEEYAFDTDRRELHRGADVVSVAPQVFDLLDYLIRNRERVVSKDDLINAVWNGRSVSDAALTTRLNAVRSAIGDSGEEQRLIKTLPRKGFRFVGPVREAQGAAGAATADNPVEPPNPVLTLPDKPSIAVLPFTNLSSDPEQDYFADGMAEDIITALSHFKSLFVIARNSSFTYKGRAVDVKPVGSVVGEHLSADRTADAEQAQITEAIGVAVPVRDQKVGGIGAVVIHRGHRRVGLGQARRIKPEEAEHRRPACVQIGLVKHPDVRTEEKVIRLVEHVRLNRNPVHGQADVRRIGRNLAH